MASATLHAAIVAPLLHLAAAREYSMSHPAACKPIARDLCSVCGGSNRAHPSWVSFTVRCASDWHRS